MSDVAVIIPAYNEAPRIGAVVRAALAAEYPRHVLVVDDGSSDDTAKVAHEAGAHVLCKSNGGKASAMHAGALAVHENALCFLDGDLDTITPAHVDSLILPYLRGVKMVVGLVDKHQKMFWSVFAGPRVLARTAWLWAVMVEPRLVSSGYGVEVILAAIANRYGWTVAEVSLDGIKFVNQQEKWGGRKDSPTWMASRIGRSMKMWGRVVKVASQVGGRHAIDDVWKPMVFQHGFVNKVEVPDPSPGWRLGLRDT